MEERDVVIVGGGPAGYTAAIRVVQLGGKATLVERDAIGGVCLNHSCIPLVALGRAVELLEMGKSAKDYGIAYKDVALDFHKMMARKEMIVKTLVSGVKQMLDAYGVEVIEGGGKLISPAELEVHLKNGEKKRLRPRKTILSTGCRYPEVSFTGGGKAIHPVEALRLKECPRAMVIVGGGFIGSAMATIFSKLGAKVTLVEESSRLIPEVDREITAILEKELKDRDIQILTKSRVVKSTPGKGNILNVFIDHQGAEVSVQAQTVVVTEGREPNLEGLREAGMRLHESGGISVNQEMETNLPGVYAAGDVTMGQMWTSAAYAEAITAAENAMGQKAKMDYRAVPRWAFTIPEVSSVGMTEQEASAAGHQVRVGRFPFAGNGMAAIMGQRTGMVKVVKEQRYGQILGVHMIGPRAADLIGEAALAMKVEGTPAEIAGTLHVHPSLSEALWEAARGV